jgi:Protein of unknown function (DUF2750)
MQYAPTSSELKLLQTLSAIERFEYTTPRLIESEEVWSIGNDDGWLIREEGEQQIIALWPYRQLAAEYAELQEPDSMPQSVSLEQFIYSVLKQCRSHDIKLEVLPTPQQGGQIIAAENLYEILDGMLESGRYFVEG